MYPFSEHRPDCRIFFKRLVTPDPEITKIIPIGTSHLSVASGSLPGYGRGAFRNYYPENFRKSLLDKYRTDYTTPTSKLLHSIQEEKKTIAQLEKSIASYNKQLETLPPGSTEIPIVKQKLTKAEDQLAVESTTLKNNQISYSTVRAIYEPYLLELMMGLVSVNTTINRDGVGTAGITIKLPLEENGFVENILYGIENAEMFDSEKMEKKSIQPNQMSNVEKISSRKLSIFKIVRDSDGAILYTERRECAFLPNDMVQVYFTKRYTTGKSIVGIPRFPQDYIPGFTGFIKNTNVSFTGGQNPNYTITINCEDIGNPLRISRVNIDPAVDPRYRAEGLGLTPFVSKLQAYGDEEATGPKIIESLIRGREGYWGGVSQIEILDDRGVELDGNTGQYTFAKKTESGTMEDRKVRIASMPWQFDKIPLNIYEDLINKVWQPYVSAFKTSYRLWESDYKFRWDICKEIAEVMEFEFYADNFGVINYHPPFYNLNPANIKYFIEDKDILSEQHSFTDSGIVTSVEVVSQSQLGIPQNIVKNLSAFASADDEWIQRYGMRFRSKNIPVLAGNDKALQSSDQQKLHETRYLYARAWLNRRNCEAQSATVEIPGTPEYFLCNIVAFVGNYGEFIAKLALSARNLGVSPTVANATFGNIEVAKSEVPLPASQAKKLVENMKVYYISGISHKYTQGGSFTTSLRLTHGRLWGKHFNVGFAFSNDENDQLLQGMKELYLNRPSDDMKMLLESPMGDKLMTTQFLQFLKETKKNAFYSMDSTAIPKTSDSGAPESISPIPTGNEVPSL